MNFYKTLSKFSLNSNSKVVLFGKDYEPKTNEEKKWDHLYEKISTIIWVSYRSNFPPILETIYTNDQGWGCAIRTGQMMFSQALLFTLLGRDFSPQKCNNQEELKIYKKILSYFLDYPSSCYSIHNICSYASENFNYKIGKWFGPTSIVQTLKYLYEQKHSDQLRIYVSVEPDIYLDKISKSEKFVPIFFCISTRLGMNSLNTIYAEQLKELFTFPQFMGFVGGKPMSSYYFVGCTGNQLLYLDPHYTQTVVQTSNEGDFNFESYIPKGISQININRIDPSMTLGFLCKSEQEYENFLERANIFIEKYQGKQIFSIHKNSPNFDFDDFIEF
ncbi:cysteine protease [Anaeramoeba flamelloides]|uniref:Cysteine protease n=1 Tax=Anaeramoeba flamelloides TaxID=1746091 RepID=A0ABQ8Y1E1_9EUKA|nr:cysteine protease [Anaeramoeba flamelloides]